MERLVQCRICGKAVARNSCVMCGANVCANCFDPRTGLCMACAKGRK